MSSCKPKLRRKPSPINIFKPKNNNLLPKSLCQWCSNQESEVYMGTGYYCPHYHGGTPTILASMLVDDMMKQNCLSSVVDGVSNGA